MRYYTKNNNIIKSQIICSDKIVQLMLLTEYSRGVLIYNRQLSIRLDSLPL